MSGRAGGAIVSVPTRVRYPTSVVSCVESLRPRELAIRTRRPLAEAGKLGLRLGIGSHVLAELQQHGHEVTALVRNQAAADAIVSRGARAVVVDLFDRPAVVKELSKADGAIQTASPGDATTAEFAAAVVDAWMHSAEHCRNILTPTYRNVGTGVSPHPVGSFASGPSTWTEDFGLLMSNSAPSQNWGPADGCPY